jgi:hypothetical protein
MSWPRPGKTHRRVRGFGELPGILSQGSGKKNLKLPADGAGGSFRVRGNGAEKAQPAIRGRVYGMILRAGKTVRTAGEGIGGGGVISLVPLLLV